MWAVTFNSESSVCGLTFSNVLPYIDLLTNESTDSTNYISCGV